MKVALIDPSHFTPPYDQALMGGLRSAGCVVRLYTKFRAPTQAPEPDPEVIQHFYPALARRLPSRLPPLAQRLIKAGLHAAGMRRLVADLHDWRPEIIHFQWLPLPVVDRFFLSALRQIAPLVFTVHDSNPFNSSPTAGIQRWGAQSILTRFDALIVHTDQASSRLIAEGLPRRKIVKIAHGLLFDGMRNLDAGASPARPTGAVVNILMFGKIKPYKGADVLIRALSLLSPSERAKCLVRIVGQPYMNCDTLRQLAARQGVDDCLQFDFRFVEDSEIPRIFALASVIVFPYREIDASGVLMTAVAAGRPIVATKVGSFDELLSDGINALLVPPNDHQALADALRRIISNVALRDHLAAGTRHLRDTMPTWDEIGRTTHAIYKSLILAR